MEPSAIQHADVPDGKALASTTNFAQNWRKLLERLISSLGGVQFHAAN
jgi:hypothetical protein